MVDNLSSDWRVEHLNGNGNGSAIISSGWLHSGQKREIQIDKVIPAPGAEPSTLGEKITRVKFNPTLQEMGGCGIDGVFGITAQGSLIVHVFNNFEPDRKSSVTKQLTLPSWNYTYADFAYKQNGCLLIALSEGIVNKPVRMIDVKITKCNPFQRPSNGDNELRVEIEEQKSLLSSDINIADPSFFDQDCFLSHLCFPHHEYSDQIITVYSNEKQSVLCWWMLRPDSLPVPALLGGQLQIKSWKCVNNVSLDRITSITSHSLPVQPDKFYNSNFSCGHLLAIACLSGSFYLVHKLKLDIMQRMDYGQLIKQSELPGNINEDTLRACVSATFSPTGCALFTLDNMARISVIQVKPWRDAEVPLSQKEAAIEILLSYAMLNDVDSWDTRNLLNDLVKRDAEIVRRLDKQLQMSVESDPNFHQPYLASCQAQRILLLGRLEMFQADYSTTLSSILSASFLNLFTSLLRPLRTNLDELSAGEKLREIAVSRAEPDLESALTQILSAFETDPKILAKIPHLVQWVTHLILWQTTSVKQKPLDKVELCRARQLLIIIRLWSHLMSSCSPQFTTKDSKIDVLSELFRLLTQLWASKEKDEAPANDVIEACVNLRGRVYVQAPNLDLPFRPELNQAKIQIGSYPKIFSTSGAITRDTVDFVRRTKMGVNEIRHLRRCSRSGVCTQKRTETPLPVWDDRFIYRTFCLGLWTRAIPSRKRPAVDVTQELLEFNP